MPIDIAFGTTKLDYIDVALPGKIPLVWDRRYSSALLNRPLTALGWGWTNRYFATLKFSEGRFEFVTAEGGTEIFPDGTGLVAKGRVIRNLGAFLEIFQQNARYIVQEWNVDTGDVLRYCFHPSGANTTWNLSSIEDVTGQGIDLTWELPGRLRSVRQRLEGRELCVAYDNAGLIERVFLNSPNGEVHPIMTYAYDDLGCQIEARDAAKFADRFEYDRKGRVTREIVKDGGVFRYRYDDKGRCVLRTGLAHYNEKRLRYVDAIHVTEVTDSYGRSFTYHHLPSGQAVRESDPLGGQRITEYDQHGRIVAKIDATGATTRYVFDELGNRSEIVDALGGTTKFKFNAHHQALSMTDAAGHLWRRGYDANHRLIESTDPLGNCWLFRYDPQGNVVEVSNPRGDRKRQMYEGGVLRSTTDWMGNVTQFRFDAFGRISERRGVLGELTRFEYDVLGHPTRVTLPDGATLMAGYDHAGNLTHFTDARGHTTRWRYGPCMQLLERTDRMGRTVRFVWGSERGRLDRVINEKGEFFEFFRDEGGRVTREVSFDGAERHYEYDSEGHSTAFTNSMGETVKVNRDALHRVVAQILPDGSKVAYAFDAVGNLTRATTSDIAVILERDPLGRIVRETQGEHWVERKYDAVGNILCTSTNSGHVVNYQVDANGFVEKLTTLGDKGIDFARNAYGQETVRRMPGGAQMNLRYDDIGRLVEQRVATTSPMSGGTGTRGESELIRRTYTYDGSGSLVRATDGASGWVDYTYDPADRLLSALRERGTSEQFEYDATGNIVRLRTVGDSVSDETLTYGPGNLLLRKGTTRYEYDRDGRRTRKIETRNDAPHREWKYSWDALDRLTTVTCPDQKTWCYTYDALGRRVRKSSDESQHTFHWDRDVVVEETLPNGDTQAWMYDRSKFAPVSMIRGGELLSVINDHLGTPRELVDRSGQIKLSVRGSSWGLDLNRPTDDEGASCAIRFPGQWLDDETGLHYNYHRYYDPQCGLYLSRDPAGLFGGSNLYQYVRNPNKSVDPLGLIEEVDPNSVTFTQRTVSENNYADQMRANQWDWERSGPLRVMDVNGQLVSYDNRRLDAAQEAGLAKVPVEVVSPDDIMPGSKKTWAQAFSRRRNDPRNVAAGGAVPEEGTSERPTHVGPGCSRK